VRGVLIACLGSSALLAGYLVWTGTYPGYWTALRHVSFNLVSIATDCGFASTDYSQWPIFVPLWMLFLSCVTASSGSTGGGIKMVRTLILIGQARRDMLRLVHPNAVIPLKVGRVCVPESVAQSVLGFIFLYFMSVVLLTFVLLLSGLDFMSAFTAVIATINNAGPGLGVVGPAGNYQGLTDFQTWVCSFAMLLGRLEVMSLLIIFTPGFWRK
jgi:trk system potassium uptake protein TrkH